MTDLLDACQEGYRPEVFANADSASAEGVLACACGPKAPVIEVVAILPGLGWRAIGQRPATSP